jgi:hypothetical protein
VGIANNSSPLSFVPSPDHVLVPLVAGPTHDVVPSYFVGHASHVTFFSFGMHMLYHLIFL